MTVTAPLRSILLVLVACVLLSALPAAAQTEPPPVSRAYMPLVSGPRPPTNPFGFDLRSYTTDEVMQFVADAKPKWSRAGDILWASVETEPGVYNWDAMAAVASNVRRLRERGIEPALVVHQSPAWAQKIPGRLCSPPSPDHLDDFARFMAEAVRHFPEVKYWEIWNEPDSWPERVPDSAGVGCWGVRGAPDNGGRYYGEMLKQVYPAMKAASPDAVVFAGALASFWPDDDTSMAFLRGILDVGAGPYMDVLTFHAYGEWGAGDLLIAKTRRFRAVLGEYGLGHKPLVATEVAATCRTNEITTCLPNYNEWIRRQGNYAARIYAEAIALDLDGAFWYTLTLENPGFAYSHLIDQQDGVLVPRPAYYAFRNSALLLNGAKYVGPPLEEPGLDQMEQVQVLQFRKRQSSLDASRGSGLYVMWVPKLDFPKQPYALRVWPGATALCTQLLDQATSQRYYCSDTNKDGIIYLGINSWPFYVEVID